MRHRKTSRREACTGQKEQGRGEVKRGPGEGERREVEARAVVGRCERREGEAGEGGLVSRDNRRRGANQPRIRKAASCCSRVVCVASRMYRVTRYRGKDAYAYHLYYVASQRLALSSHPPSLQSFYAINRERTKCVPSFVLFDRGSRIKRRNAKKEK